MTKDKVPSHQFSFDYSTSTNLLKMAVKVLNYECDALQSIASKLDSTFLEGVNYLHNCEGKIVVTGLGKSGIAGKKIAATLASTGTPAFFLHAGEAIHGDMGVISSGDVAIALSYSGETKEIISLIPRFKVLGVPLIGITGNPQSSLAKLSDCILDISVKSYPWPFGIIPTASYITTVAMGDALAIALLELSGVKEQDFALLHPGGLLGSKILAQIGTLMHTGDEIPIVQPDTRMKDVLLEMTSKRLGIACVVDNQRRLVGIITDGDLRRLLEKYENPFTLTAEKAMTLDPVCSDKEMLSARALHQMESYNVTSLPIVDHDKKLIGVIHLHDIIRQETNR